jgi:hypothetical protein
LQEADMPLRAIVEANIGWTVGSNSQRNNRGEHLGFAANAERIDLEDGPKKCLLAPALRL